MVYIWHFLGLVLGQERGNMVGSIMNTMVLLYMFLIPLVWSKQIKVFNLAGSTKDFLKMVKDPGARDFKEISVCMR